MRRVVAFLAATAAVLALPAAASAHGIVGRQDLPMPRWLFAWALGIVLVGSFIALSTLWPRARFEGFEPRRRFGLPSVLDPVAGLLGVAIFAFVVYAGLAGADAKEANLATQFVFVIFWVGTPFLCLCFGDVFRPLNPWRALGRLVGFAFGRVSRGASPEVLAYPERLGRWPAAGVLLTFTWVELAWVDGKDPQVIAVLALVYAAIQLVGMSLYGVEQWTRNADGFAVYFDLVGRLSPLRLSRGGVFTRPPFVGLTAVAPGAGVVAVLCVLIGTTSFDGFQGAAAWGDIAPELQSWFIDLGLGAESALEAAVTVGLVAGVLVIAGLYRIGVHGMRGVDRGHGAGELARRFAPTLIPIALAYVVAHYFSYLAYDGQRLGYLVSDPLGQGDDVFGTAGEGIDYGVVSANGIWYVQVAALMIGHVAALVLSHDRALVVYGSARVATRSQYWMLAVMVGFTSLGLWLLSAAAQ